MLPDGELRLVGDCTIEAAAGAEKLPTFNGVAYNGGPISVGFGDPVVVDLESLDAASTLRILKDHDPGKVVGHGVADLKAKSIRVTGTVSGAGADAAEVVAASKNGFPWQLSIGASQGRGRMEFLDAKQSAVVNGRKVEGPAYIARGFHLRETSFVALGADDTTSASIAAKARKEKSMTPEFAAWLHDAGIVNPQADSLPGLQAAFSAGLKPVPPPPKAPDSQSPDLFAIAAKQAKAIAAINAAAEGFPDIQAKALEGKWDENQVKAAVAEAKLAKIEAARGSGPAVHVRSGPAFSGEIVEAAIAQAGKLDEKVAGYSDQVMQAAWTAYRGRISLKQLMLEAAWNNGYSGAHFDHRPVLTFAFARDGIAASAGVSTHSLSGILSNTANKFLLAGFMGVEQTWRSITSMRSVSDFKAVTSYRMTGDQEYEQVKPGGQLKHGTAGQESFTNQVDTYGRMFAVDRRDIINDDLGALTSMPQRIGRGGGLKLNSVFWAEFMNNSAFFTAERTNYFEGSATNLQLSSLTTAVTMFLDQVDPDGKPLSVAPSVLLVPNALNVPASQLMVQTEYRDNTTNAKYIASNPHVGQYTVQRSSYLGNATITGNSTTAWYLLASPADLPVIETAFLNGQESPTVESADADFSTLGIQMRGYHDFGVSLQDWRAGVKSKGAA